MMASQPVDVPTGQPYGARHDLAAAQNAMPLPQGSAAPPPAGGAPAPAAGGGDRFAAALAAAQRMAPPNGLLTDQGDPNASATHGMDAGPGPGTEILGAPRDPLAPSQDDYEIARWLPMLEGLASAPDSTAAFRNLVRRLRGGSGPVTQAQVVQRYMGQGGAS